MGRLQPKNRRGISAWALGSHLLRSLLASLVERRVRLLAAVLAGARSLLAAPTLRRLGGLRGIAVGLAGEERLHLLVLLALLLGERLDGL